MPSNYVLGNRGVSMRQIQDFYHIAASSNISVLLLGESGSGKEVAARFIHDHSKRSKGPFIALNCGAIAPNLAESILEGSQKGSFTGSVCNQQGIVRAANGGTLFLDEIGEMPLNAQCKLLRILQERSVMPLGSATNIPVDFRLICATNRNLRAEVAHGNFREDLYFRLNVFPIRIPPLRERPDFATIAQSLWREIAYNEECGDERDTVALTPQELDALVRQSWPGNIRQLKNVLERYSLLKSHNITLGEILEDEFTDTSEKLYNPTPHWAVLQEALHRNNWNKSITAHQLGISRGSLCYQLKKHSDK